MPDTSDAGDDMNAADDRNTAVTLRIPMHAPGGRFVTLSDVLAHVPEGRGAAWTWRVLEFTGVGEMPGGLSVEEFEEAALESPAGLPFDWPALRDFAGRVEQVQDLILIAVEEGTEPDPAALEAMDLSGSPFVIEAVDSTEWQVTDRTR
ncbi:hypothetical protein AB0B50_42440 [Streptomyces sp. NPDC041068]|uniref:hypothetical protein n=1 Tax=Streptomyces sp. NPDC041068 TaxID=3155130 RepID=UPI0033DD28D9